MKKIVSDLQYFSDPQKMNEFSTLVILNFDTKIHKDVLIPNID